MNLLYGTYLAFTLLGTLALLHTFKVKLTREKKKAVIFSLISVAIIFVIWDVLAVSHGHWSFNPGTVVGIWFGNQPLEEVLFFLIIPFFGIVLYEIFHKRRDKP